MVFLSLLTEEMAMIKRLTLLTVLTIMFMTLRMYASDTHLGTSIRCGIYTPTGAVSDLNFGSCFSGGVSMLYSISNDFDLFLGIDYMNWKNSATIDTQKASYKNTPISIGFNYYFMDWDKFSFYGSFDISVNLSNVDWNASAYYTKETIAMNSGSTCFGITPGIGITYEINHLLSFTKSMFLNLSAKYSIVDDRDGVMLLTKLKESQVLGDNFDKKLTYLSLNFGVIAYF